MNAPTPQAKTYDFKKECLPYCVTIKSDSTTMTITVTKEEEIPKKKFTSSFQFDELLQRSKWFCLFDTMEGISNEISCLFNDGKYKFKEDYNKINLYLLIKTRQIDDIVLEISQTDVQSNETLIQDICSMINEMNKKIKLQSETFALLEKSPEFNKMYKEGLAKQKKDSSLK